jgi:predicted NBD/HSP70 family sugar kinase
VLGDSGIDQNAILGVGVGVPGIIEQGPEVLVHGQTYGWDAVPLERLLRAHTALPLRFDNGAKTMGQAELWFGAGKGARNAVVVLVGSGVGASLISGGATYQGATSSGAEFGHITVVVDGGRRCRCGSTGCLEAYAGAEAILARYGRPMAADDQELALAELIDAAGTSPHAAAVLDETAQYLGAGIGTLINLFNPERVILGGWGGLLLGERLLPDIREAARQHSLRHPFASTSIELGRLGPDVVALGAATLPVESFLNGSSPNRSSYRVVLARRASWGTFPRAWTGDGRVGSTIAAVTRPTTDANGQTTRSNGSFERGVLVFLPMTDRQQGADGHRCEQERQVGDGEVEEAHGEGPVG